MKIERENDMDHKTTSEWAPARLSNPHRAVITPDAQRVINSGRIVEYRPAQERRTVTMIAYYRSLGCDANSFFEVIMPNGKRMGCCEHELLAD